MEDVKLLLVGNKVDLEDQRQVTTRRGEKVSVKNSLVLQGAIPITCLCATAGKATQRNLSGDQCVDQCEHHNCLYNTRTRDSRVGKGISSPMWSLNCLLREVGFLQHLHTHIASASVLNVVSHFQTENKIRVQRGEGNGTLGRSKIVLGEGESNEDPGEGGGGCWC